jgi:hypothetical protein
MIPLGLFQKAKQLRVLFVTIADIVLLDDQTLQMFTLSRIVTGVRHKIPKSGTII